MQIKIIPTKKTKALLQCQKRKIRLEKLFIALCNLTETYNVNDRDIYSQAVWQEFWRLENENKGINYD